MVQSKSEGSLAERVKLRNGGRDQCLRFFEIPSSRLCHTVESIGTRSYIELYVLVHLIPKPPGGPVDHLGLDAIAGTLHDA